jgi:hypothetical protein
MDKKLFKGQTQLIKIFFCATLGSDIKSKNVIHR